MIIRASFSGGAEAKETHAGVSATNENDTQCNVVVSKAFDDIHTGANIARRTQPSMYCSSFSCA
jgi:hypothetical protein